MFDLLVGIAAVLFWPVVIFLLIRYWRRPSRTGRQGAAELTELREHVEDLGRRLTDASARIGRLERQLGAMFPPAESMAELEFEPVPAAEGREEGQDVEPRRVAEILGLEPAPEAAGPAAEALPPPTETRAEVASAHVLRRRELERRFMENWTGILGAVVVVAGVTFVGIYTALRLEPFHRFLLTLAAGGAVLAGSVVLARKEQWRAFAGWLRSTGAAIVLFACAASGGLRGLGLQWIFEPVPALALLLAGIAGNLYLAHAGGTQVIATFHVLLSLLPLALVPASTTSLATASAVVAFGVAMKPRGRWDLHLALLLGAYLLFHEIWYARMGDRLDPDAARLIAAGCAALVFCAASLAHYRDERGARQPSSLQLGVHLANWALLAITLFVYVPTPIARGAALLVAGALAYRLAQRARRLAVAWLMRADLLTAQAFVLLALASLFDLGASLTLVALIAFAETLAFRLVVPRQEDTLLETVANALPVLAGTLLAVIGLSEIAARTGDLLACVAVLLAGSAVAVLGQRVLRVPAEAAEPSFRMPERDTALAAGSGILLGWLAGALIVVALYGLLGRGWLETVALAATGTLLLAARRTRRAGLEAGTLIALLGAHFVSWVDLVTSRDWMPIALTPRIGALATLAVLVTSLAGPGRLRRVAAALLGIDLGLAAFLYFDPLSPLIPGVAWLMLSLGAVEVADRLRDREGRTVLLLGYGYVVAFALAYALVIVQTPAYVGLVSARLLIELFAIGVLAYWWFFRPRESLAGARSWILVHPLFLEILLAALAVSVMVEVAAQWWAVAWATIALGLLAPPGERLLDARARVYSLFFYWASVADMAIVMSVMEVPSRRLVDRPEFTSLVAIVLQVAYVAWAQRRLLLEGLEAPRPMQVVARLARAVAGRRNLYVYYPLFAGIAVFLFWRFDRSLLTLLWAAEAFVVFGLSAWLRENQFRYVALGGLAACLVRLVLIDMAEANLALRGAVFIGVGLLMLGMNAIYNRYRTRFQA